MVTLGVIAPSVARELGLSYAETLWIVNSYFLTLAMFTGPSGRLGDMYGHRLVLLIGLLVLAGGGVVAAFAPNFAILVVGLAVSGMGGAALMPSTIAIVSNAVPPERVGSAFGKTVAFGITAFMVGPLVAGVITSSFGWRAAVGLSVVLAVAFALIGWRGVPPSPRRGGSLDPFGVLLLCGGIGLFIVAILQISIWGITSLQILVLFAGAVGLLAAYAWHSHSSQEPLLNLALLRNSTFRGATFALMAGQFAINAYAVFIALYMQHVLGLSAMMTGVGMLAAYALPPMLSPLTGRLTDRIGPRPVATFGTSFLALSGLLTVAFASQERYLYILPSLLAMGLATTITLTSLVVASSRALAPEKRGEGQGLQVTLRWVAAALGSSIVGVVVHTFGVDATHSAQAEVEGYLAGFSVVAVLSFLALAMVRFTVPK